MRKPSLLRGMVVGLSILGLAGVAYAAESTKESAKVSASSTAWLGIYSQTLTDDLREGLDYKGEGLLINRVVPDSPADKAGLKKGDVITTVNSRAPGSSDDLFDLIRGKKVGETVTFGIVREGQKRTVSAKLAARPDEDDLDQIIERSMSGLEGMDGDHMVHVFRGGRGRLGVRLESLNPDLGGYFSIPSGKGALVTEVLKDTPAEKAGLKAGDVITKIGGDPVASAGDAVDALRDKEGKVAIETSRRGVKRTTEIELEKAPEMHSWSMGPGSFHWHDDGDVNRIVHRMKFKDGDSDEAAQKELKEMREQLRQLQDQVKEMNKSK